MVRRAHKQNRRHHVATRWRWKHWGIVLAALLSAAVCFVGWQLFPIFHDAMVAPIEPPALDDANVDKAVAVAVNAAREAVLASPDNSQRWGELGSIFLAHDFTLQASACLEQAAKLDSTEPRWVYLHARSLLYVNPRDAIPLLERTVELCGDDPHSPRLTLVEVLLEQHELDEAEGHLQQFMSRHPDDPRARLSLGRLLFMRQDYDGCARTLASLSRELEEQPHKSGGRKALSLLLAEALQRTGREVEAQAYREKANSQVDTQWPDPFMAEVRARRTGLKPTLVRADLMYGRGNYDDSIDLLRETLETYPESLWAKIYLARALIRTGNPTSPYTDREARLRQAIEILEKTVESHPESPEAFFRLGVAYTYQGNHRRAAVLHQKAVDLKPDFTMAFYNLAQSKYKLQDLDGAIQALRKAVDTEPGLAQGYKMLGQLLMARRSYDEAERELQTALRLRPDSQEIARLYARAKQLKSEADP